jgi:hypothetical protein
MPAIKFILFIIIITFIVNSLTYFYLYKKLCDLGHMPPTYLNPNFFKSFHIFITRLKKESNDPRINTLFKIYLYIISVTSMILLPFGWFGLYLVFFK